MNSMYSVQWPANPDYGSGIFRRRVRVCCDAGKVTVELEDCNHGFRVCLYHDGGLVENITADTIRYPHNTCPEAVKQLRQFIGLPVNAEAESLRAKLAVAEHCTHLYDMAMLAHTYSSTPETEQIYDIAVTDEVEGKCWLSIDSNEEQLHKWCVEKGIITSPGNYQGLPVMRGFYARALQ